MIDRAHRHSLRSLSLSFIQRRLKVIFIYSCLHCTVFSFFSCGDFVTSSHILNLNQPLVCQECVRHRAVPVSYGPFHQRCPWGMGVTVLITCHTIFITVTRLFMGLPVPSEPAVSSAISPVPLVTTPPLLSSISPVPSPPHLCPPLFLPHPSGFSPHLTLFSSFFYRPLSPCVHVILLTLPLTNSSPIAKGSH